MSRNIRRVISTGNDSDDDLLFPMGTKDDYLPRAHKRRSVKGDEDADDDDDVVWTSYLHDNPPRRKRSQAISSSTGLPRGATDPTASAPTEDSDDEWDALLMKPTFSVATPPRHDPKRATVLSHPLPEAHPRDDDVIVISDSDEEPEGLVRLPKPTSRHHEPVTTQSVSRVAHPPTPFSADDLSGVTQLRKEGYVVIPCVDPRMLRNIRAEFDQTLKNFPEFKRTATAYVLGGFAALSNPSSFHNLLVRKLRQWAMSASVETIWKPYINKYYPGYNFEQCICRMLYRAAGTKPATGLWHRDDAEHAEPGDSIFGGWINLDSAPQYFRCVPRSHRSVEHNTVGSRRGFDRINDKDEQKRFQASSRDVAVPPGHLLIFQEHIIHTLYAVAVPYPMYRLHTSWRITRFTHPLDPPREEDLRRSLAEQAVMPLKSGQQPAMFAQLHWTNWLDRLVQFSHDNINPACLVRSTLKSGKRKGEVIETVPRVMKSLHDYGLPLYPAYTEHEIEMHLPRRSWNVLRPNDETTIVHVSLD